jgi:NADPH:quinone reductase-like Zn-dependent oxidoreductase
MKAVVCTRYGPPDVLELKEVHRPTPGPGEILVRVHVSSATKADTMMRRGSPAYARLFLGLSRPKKPITGTGFAGTIESVGEEVTGFKPGQRVFGETGVGFSTNAEYLSIDEDALVASIPDALGFEEAAPLCDGALTSMNFLSHVHRLRAGETVLVNGASGSLGTAAVQIAKHFGAEVVGVCSAANVDLVKDLGADRAIDYRKEDFTDADGAYDVVYDTIGKSSFTKCRRALKEGGVFISPVLSMPLLFRMMWTSRFGRKKAKFSATGMRPVPELRPLLNEVLALIENGELRMVIDRRFPLEETSEAHRYIEKGHKRGNVVILSA